MDKPSHTATTVCATMPFLSGDPHTELLEGEFIFHPEDPYAVEMHLEVRSGTVVWTFARQLLAEGLYGPAGDGDVRVWPCLGNTGGAVVIIELSSPEGVAVLQAPSREVAAFVAATEKIVPTGHEASHLQLDTLISRLLAAGERRVEGD